LGLKTGKSLEKKVVKFFQTRDVFRAGFRAGFRVGFGNGLLPQLLKNS
jgi:hypothetical protein